MSALTAIATNNFQSRYAAHEYLKALGVPEVQRKEVIDSKLGIGRPDVMFQRGMVAVPDPAGRYWIKHIDDVV